MDKDLVAKTAFSDWKGHLNHAIFYIGDIIIFSVGFKEHLKDVEPVRGEEKKLNMWDTYFQEQISIM